MIEVAAGVLCNARGQALLMQRLPGKHLAGLWEFPGGKLEPGEDVNQALVRELREELGIEVDACEFVISLPWHYAEKTVRLHALRVTAWRGEPTAVEGNPLRWVALDDIDVDVMPAADAPIVAALRLPPYYRIDSPRIVLDASLPHAERWPPHSRSTLGEEGDKHACESDRSFAPLRQAQFGGEGEQQQTVPRGEEVQQNARTGHSALSPLPHALDGGEGSKCAALAGEGASIRGALWQLRMSNADRDAVRQSALRALAIEPRLRQLLLINHDIELARDLHVGVHLKAAQLRELRERPLPRNVWIGASCHDAEELDRAASLGADFATLSPVCATASHPDVAPLGWERFAQLVADARLPVYALGGVAPDDLGRARAAGAQGVAGIRAFRSVL